MKKIIRGEKVKQMKAMKKRRKSNNISTTEEIIDNSTVAMFFRKYQRIILPASKPLEIYTEFTFFFPLITFLCTCLTDYKGKEDKKHF